VERSGDFLYSGHLPGIQDDLSAEENLKGALALRGVPHDAGGVAEALARAGLARRRHLPARRLSAGQRRRIGLARLMLDPAPIWILDEPLTALDDDGQRLFGELLGRLLDRGGLALVATHHEMAPPRRASCGWARERSAGAMNVIATRPLDPAPAGSFSGGFAWAFGRDLTLALRHPGETLLVVAFFVLVASLFPLGVGADPQLLTRIGPGVIWVCALLAAFLSLPALLAGDYADGSLEQMALSPHPMASWVSGKIAAHWVATGLPLTLLSPLLGLQYGLAADTLAALAVALVLGTPVISLLGAACTALALGARGGGMLLALLALPLFVPVLIFGAGAAEAQAAGLSPAPHLSLLGAGLILAVMAVPFAACAAIRIALD
jgi:heme exporter protein B